MKVDKTAIIGGGHLGAAIAEGLLNSGWAEPSSLWVTRRQADKLSALAARGVQTGSDNCAAVRKATVVLLVVKDRKSTRLNSSHVRISYAVFCLKKKKKKGLRHMQTDSI